VERGPVKELLVREPELDGLIVCLANLTGRSTEAIRQEIAEHVAWRTIFVLLGLLETAPNFDALERRAITLFGGRISDPTSLIGSLATTLLEIEAAQIARRTSIRDLTHVKRRALLEAQGNRCAVCGWNFTTSAPEISNGNRRDPTLDHKIPIRLGGDGRPNLWVLCHLCNSIKREYVHVSETGPLWIDNYIYWGREKATIFWTMFRDKSCTNVKCKSGPQHDRMYVVRRGDRGPWVLDNCVTKCSAHVRHDQAFEY
jgi:5-methylcytosine-specific restriction endonuclease McrA